MATKSKKKSAAYRLINEETGTHYIVRMGRESYDKMKDKLVSKYDRKTHMHAKFKVKKVK